MDFTSQTSSQEHETTYNRQEDYIAAQRAGAEAVLIGRETLETVVRQGEQLQNAENLADETEYTLDRATRLLKGMTWSGWLGNKFSRDVEPPEYKTDQANTNTSSTMGPPKVYENAPHSCMAAAQAVQNYNANLQVLETCETEEQKETCKLICDNMYQQATKEVTMLHQQDLQDGGDFPSRLQKDLKTLRVCQLKYQTPPPRPTPTNNATTTNGKSRLFHGKSESSSTPSPTDVVEGQQEEHLDAMSRHLEELGSLATNLNDSMSRQSDTLETLDGKSESMLFKSKMVTRRADRIIQKKSWTKTKAEFLYNVSIRHVKSGKYLSVSTNNNALLILSSKYNEMCIFGTWQRKNKLFGLQNKYSRRWAGQNLLGNLVCSATYFDRREEWDADDDWSETPILCTSAGWGNGGYLIVRPEDGVVSIGGGGLQDKKIADLWCIKEHVR